MVIIQSFLKSIEALFSVEYIIPPLIIYGVFNWLFPVIWVISVYYCIGNPLFHIFSISTLWCVSFALFPPFSMSVCPTDVPHPWQGFVSFYVFSPHTPFLFASFLCSFSLPVSATSVYQTWYALAKTHTISFSFLPITSLFSPPQISELPAPRTSKPTTRGFWRLLLSFLSESSLNHSNSDME